MLLKVGSMMSARPLVTDPVLQLGALNIYTDLGLDSKMTFGTGNEVTAVQSLKGPINFVSSEATNMEFDSSLFNGRGGIKTIDSNSDLNYDSGTGGPAITSVGFVCELPPYSGVNSDFFAIGNSNFGGSKARLLHIDVGRVAYGETEGGSFEEVFNVGSDGICLFILNYKSDSLLDITFIAPDGTEGVVSFDPDNSYQNDIGWIGDRGDDRGEAGVGYGKYFQNADALTAAEVSSIKADWKKLFF